MNGKERRQITKGKWEVTQFYGYDDVNKILYYQSNEESPLEKDIYRINVWGRSKQKLSSEKGTNNASFSKNYSLFINTHSNANSPNTINLYNKKGEQLNTIKNSDKLRETLKKLQSNKKRFL